MPIERVFIKKFRMIQNQEFQLGKRVTVITGQNGSMKSTLLGMIAEPFRFRDLENKRSSYPVKAVDGLPFETSLKDTFKFSHDVFDKPGEHEWTITVSPDIDSKINYTIVSEKRKDTESYRFWKKGDREEGSGHLQLPTIYLSLKRLMPIGELKKIEATEIELSVDEKSLYHALHDDILHLTTHMVSADLVTAPNNGKNTLGITTDCYDSLSNSAGQDNVGKIILALISFKRLADSMGADYKGGLLLIDEVDATLYPAAQRTLVQKLAKYAGELDLQVVVSTHSEEIVKSVFEKSIYADFTLLYLSAIGQTVSIDTDLTLENMLNHLKLEPPTRQVKKEVSIYCEDVVGRAILKNILPVGLIKLCHLVPVDMGWTELLELARKKVPEFSTSLIILDGDVAHDAKFNNGVKPRNVLLLPTGGDYPENPIYFFFKNLDQNDGFWSGVGDYNYQLCFNGYESEDGTNKERVKNWFYGQSSVGGKNYQSKLIKEWALSCKPEISAFIKKFRKQLNAVYEKKYGV
jgi:energy-coupling factor transporter ATP-binding protein EcfA2